MKKNSTPASDAEQFDPQNLRERIVQGLSGLPLSRDIADLDDVYQYVVSLGDPGDRGLCMWLLPVFADYQTSIVDRLRELFEWVRYGKVRRYPHRG